MKDDKVTDTILKFLEADLVATKQIAQSAIEIARENKETSAVLQVHLSNVNKQMEGFRSDVKDLVDTAKQMFVTKVEFDPLKKLIFGAVGIVLAEFIAVLTYVVGWKL